MSGERLAVSGERLAVSGEKLAVSGERMSGERIVCMTSDRSVAYVNGVSEEIFKVGMCLPAGPCVSDEDVAYIVETIKSAIVPKD